MIIVCFLQEAIKDDDEYKVDMGDKVDHWFKTYGTAVLNDTLRDGYAR